MLDTLGGTAATGTGAVVRATSPTLATPILGTPQSGTLTNCTGLPTAGLVDDAVTLAKLAAGTAGNLITYDASGNPAAVATGTSGQVLTSNGAGAAPTFQAAAGGGSVATDAIWDAKGDLAVGTGANTAAKLTAGTNGHVLTLDSAEATGMKWAAGGSGLTSYATASLPAAPGTGAVAYCTDCLTIQGTAGSPVYYDGAKWRIYGTQIVATTDRLTLCRSLAQDHAQLVHTSKLAVMPVLFAGGATVANNGSLTFSNNQPSVYLHTTTSATGSATCRMFAGSAPAPSNTAYNDGFYMQWRMYASALSTSVEEYGFWGGLAAGLPWTTGGVPGSIMVAVGMDRGNKSGLNSGNSDNYICWNREGAVDRYSTVTSVSPSITQATPDTIEIFQSDGNQSPVVYINGTSVATLTGTLSGSTGASVGFGMLKSAGTTQREIRIMEPYFIYFYN
jgi:hypothetical protein